jgi:hypothetical protein
MTSKKTLSHDGTDVSTRALPTVLFSCGLPLPAKNPHQFHGDPDPAFHVHSDPDPNLAINVTQSSF